MAENKEIACFLCQKTEHQGVLLPCRKGGQDLWVCTRCLPMLIHGGKTLESSKLRVMS